MKRKMGLALVLATMLVLAVTAVAFAKGNSPFQLTRAGWFCVDIPGLGVHCFGPGAFRSSAAVPVKVFQTDDPSSTDAPFLGTEQLIRDDLYAGQPCPQDGGGEWVFLPAVATGFSADYRACHHYDTSH